MTIILIIIASIFVTNVVFSNFLGLCPYFGVSKSIPTSMGMGMAVVFVMTLASGITFFMQKILIHFDIAYLQTVVFILVIASLVQLVEIALKKLSPVLYKALGIYLPLITTNCAILGVAIINIQRQYNLLYNLIFAFGSAIGFTLALVIFAGVRERLEVSDIPESMKGNPISFITAGIIAMAFMGFANLVTGI